MWQQTTQYLCCRGYTQLLMIQLYRTNMYMCKKNGESKWDTNQWQCSGYITVLCMFIRWYNRITEGYRAFICTISYNCIWTYKSIFQLKIRMGLGLKQVIHKVHKRNTRKWLSGNGNQSLPAVSFLFSLGINVSPNSLLYHLEIKHKRSLSRTSALGILYAFLSHFLGSHH